MTKKSGVKTTIISNDDYVIGYFSFLEVCRTIGGNRPNQHCVFPFIYDGKSYDECTTIDNNGIPWCSTDVSCARDFVEGKWGNCGIDCSGDLGKY